MAQDIEIDWSSKFELPKPISKQLISLRIDDDVINWFRCSGKNYQTRMNAVLRSYMEYN